MVSEMTTTNTMTGKRVRFIFSADPYTRLRCGDMGTVTGIDDMGTVHVKWDSGSTLGLIREAGDAWEYVE